MIIKANYIKIVEIDSIIINPENNNNHPREQIEQLKKIIKYNGFRNPLTISNRTGFLNCGEARLISAKELGMTHLPVMFQDFDSEAEEYAHMTADNAIQQQSILDFKKINEKFPEFGPDFDIDNLGIKDFKIDFSEIELPDLGDGSDSMIIQRTFTLSTEQSDILDEALSKAKNAEDCTDEINENSNGCQLAGMARGYIAKC